MIKVNSNVKLDFGKIQMLTDAQVKAMERLQRRCTQKWCRRR